MFDAIGSKKVSKVLLFTLSLAVFLILTTRSVQYPRTDPLGIILRVEALPAGAQVLTDSELNPSEPSHPLSKNVANKTSGFKDISADDQAALTSYESGHVLSVLVPTNGVVMNFTYQFKTEIEAQTAAKIFRNRIANSPALIEERKLKGGRGYLLHGDEGDLVCWFIGSRGTGLSLLLANGIGTEKVTTLFDIALKELANQPIDLVQ